MNVISDSAADLFHQLLPEMCQDAGMEQSFKMTAGSVVSNRLLLAIDRNKIKPGDLIQLLDRLAMPETLKSDFLKEVTEANKIGFGLETRAEFVTIKVYLEFWSRLIESLDTGGSQYQPQTLFIGYKWDNRQPSRTAVDRYLCYPLLSVTGIARRSGLILGEDTPASLTGAIQQLVSQGASRLQQDAFVYCEVRAPGNKRRSFDINVYKSGFYVRDVAETIRTMGTSIATPTDTLESLLETCADHRLGHISGGRDPEGNTFVTIYTEVPESGE
ncbi:MAG: hypothetical protein GY703_17155 [Gammaproteobacteria bacterium]|nr:hypothetical protein [Gammaproteobacteria bacterium]